MDKFYFLWRRSIVLSGGKDLLTFLFAHQPGPAIKLGSSNQRPSQQGFHTHLGKEHENHRRDGGQAYHLQCPAQKISYGTHKDLAFQGGFDLFIGIH